MAPPVQGHLFVEGDQGFAEAVEIVAGARIVVDVEPGLLDALVGCICAGPVSVERSGVDGEPPAVQHGDDLVVEAGALEGLFHVGPHVGDVAVCAGQASVLVAEDELDVAEHERQLAGGLVEVVAELVEAFGGHGGDDVPRVDEELGDLERSVEHHQGVVHLVVTDEVAGVVEFEVERLEQQLLDLPHDEEARLVVGVAAGVLEGEQQVDALVVDVRVAGAVKVGERLTAGLVGHFGTTHVCGRSHRPRLVAERNPGRVDDGRGLGLERGHFRLLGRAGHRPVEERRYPPADRRVGVGEVEDHVEVVACPDLE